MIFHSFNLYYLDLSLTFVFDLSRCTRYFFVKSRSACPSHGRNAHSCSRCALASGACRRSCTCASSDALVCMMRVHVRVHAAHVCAHTCSHPRMRVCVCALRAEYTRACTRVHAYICTRVLYTRVREDRSSSSPPRGRKKTMNSLRSWRFAQLVQHKYVLY